jgi:hypothetical protein
MANSSKMGASLQLEADARNGSKRTSRLATKVAIMSLRTYQRGQLAF